METFTFDPAKHIYRVNGEEVPSVTQLARFCTADLDKSRPWLAQQAADRGTRVHECCMLLDYGELPDHIDADCAGYVKAYQRFLHDYRPEWDGIEYSGYAWFTGENAWGNIAGTVDRFGTITPPETGVRQSAIVDLKTGALHPAALSVQLTGYDLITEIIRNCTICLLYALKLNRDGTYELRRILYNETILDACMTLHNAVTPKKRRKTNE